ncbi:MAG: type II/IV secretion system protein [Paucibacter sp.]|nr:type II/IV secretion system protein [Roseateles sp.]
MVALPHNPPPALDLALLQQAQQRARASQRPLLDELCAASGASPRTLVREMAALFAMPMLETADMLALADGFDRVPLPRALQRGCALLRGRQGEWLAVVSDPFDVALQTWMAAQTGAPVVFGLALAADIHAYLAKQEEGARALEAQIGQDPAEPQEARSAAVLSFATVAEGASPAVKLLNSTLYDALKIGASDIHLESLPGGLAIKYRIDGVLDHASNLQGVETAEQVISRLKVLAELDIAERRVPQDGSFRVESGGRDIDLRVSIMPSIHGEDAVIRVLDKRAMIEAYGALTLEALGFDAESLAALRRLAEQAYGMLLVTGPTGSGKTTTLYATLTEIHNGRDKIITIEDPVEYQLPGVLQIPVNEKKGLSFAKGLRSILRHDPDKIMVGEIRDRETAEIAVQSALTGHLVLTTVHANNVFDVFGRFGHMGIDPYAFVSALNAVWAQRLVRINCPHCAQPAAAEAEELARMGLSAADVVGYEFRQGRGCGDCRGTGYRGRRSIAEILILDDELREMIVDKRPIRQIKEVARRNGTRNLRESGLALVRQGLTTLSEIRRVTQHA